MDKVPLRAYACSNHFSDTDFISPKRGLGLKRRLRKTAIPSRNIPKRKLDKSPSAEKQRKIVERTERLNARRLFCETISVESNSSDSIISPVENLAQSFENEVGHLNEVLDEVRQFEKAIQTDSFVVIEEGIQTEPMSLVEKASQTGLLKVAEKMIQATLFDVSKLTTPTIADVLRTNESISACTGIPTMQEFMKLCEAADYVMVALNVNTKFKIDTYERRVLLTLMKLKLNLSFRCLAAFFHIHPTTCSDYFFYTIDMLHSILKQFVFWFPKETIDRSMPIYFAEFSDTRVVIDCFEVPVKKTTCLNCIVRTYSHYKGTHTIKILLGTAPDGTITFISPVYGGRASDKFIVSDCKLCEMCEPGEAVMADKGFSIRDECINANLTLHIPPFYDREKENGQFSTEENELCRNVARARVHVERTIQRIRLFKIFNDRLDWLYVSHVDKIMRVIGALVNLSSPILSDERFNYK